MSELTDLEEILVTMNIPEMRRDVSNPDNLRWLSRNVAIQNGDHPRLKEVINNLRKLLTLM